MAKDQMTLVLEVEDSDVLHQWRARLQQTLTELARETRGRVRYGYEWFDQDNPAQNPNEGAPWDPYR